MQPSKVNDRWPTELKRAHWRQALGKLARLKPENIGKQMEEAEKLFRLIIWDDFHKKNEDEKLEYYGNRIRIVEVKLDRLHEDIQQQLRNSKHMDDKYASAARKVGVAAQLMAEQLGQHAPGRYTPRSLARAQSEGQKLAPRATDRGKALWERYKGCSKDLMIPFFNVMPQTMAQQERGFFNLCENTRIFIIKIDWNEYSNYIYTEDKDQLRQFYKDNVREILKKLLHIEEVADKCSKYHNGDDVDHDFRAESFLKLKNLATELYFYYRTLPGSMYTHAWEENFSKQ